VVLWFGTPKVVSMIKTEIAIYNEEGCKVWCTIIEGETKHVPFFPVTLERGRYHVAYIRREVEDGLPLNRSSISNKDS